MKVLVKSGRVEEEEFPLLAINLFEGEAEVGGAVKAIDRLLDGAITQLLKSGEFRAKLNQTTTIYTLGRLKTKRILLVGLGKRSEYDLEAVRSVSGKAAQTAKELKLKSYTQLIPEEGKLDVEAVAQAFVEGCGLSLYQFNQYKTEKEEEPTQLEEFILYTTNPELTPKLQRGIAVGEVMVESVSLARDLSNLPSNECTPTILAEKARAVAEANNLTYRVLERKDMEELGMGGILSVSSGSEQPPKLIILEYRGGGEEQPIVLVGKAVTFDSGGISIKPSEKMEEMKYDKSGGAAVIAIMQAVAKLKLPINLVGLIPATENLPGGRAYKPGDIIRIYGGKTVEVISTDAEGRLIMSDALSYAAQHYKPQVMIDIATLTGACIVALGATTIGMMGNNERLKEMMRKAAETTGEKVWELPLWREYDELIKSRVADVKNVGGRPAGAITAAAFLQKFVGAYPWVHLDIAGTAYTQEGSVDKTYIPKGATGVGVRLITQLLRSWGFK